MMALLLLPSLSFLPSPISSSSSSAIHIAAFVNYRRIQQKNLILQQCSFHGVRIQTSPNAFAGKRLMIVRASSEIDGKDALIEPEALPSLQSSEGEGVVPVESLPLESKLQLKMEQKLRMKLAKKIRLRRKRLVRKRRMRKKGRWPPSKMKKNKNV